MSQSQLPLAPNYLPLHADKAGTLGHDCYGIRTFYLPGDSPNYFKAEQARWKILNGLPLTDAEDDLQECPECGAIEPLQDCDIGGADDGNCFCIGCQAEIPIHTLGMIDCERKLGR